MARIPDANGTTIMSVALVDHSSSQQSAIFDHGTSLDSRNVLVLS
jgi:hypothetical protein